MRTQHTDHSLPDVSIVIPAYNEERTIADSIAAVQRSIAYAQCDAEIIVVDNASTDSTARIAKRQGATVFHEYRKGITFARQAGLEASRGQLIGNVDADTLMPEWWLRRTLEALRRKPDVIAITGPMTFYDFPSWKNAIVRRYYGLSIFLPDRSQMLHGGNNIIRRDALIQAGGHDSSIAFYGEDADLGRRLAGVGRMIFDPSLVMPTSARRLAEEGIIRTGMRYTLNYAWVHLFQQPLHHTYRDIRP